MLFDLTHTDVLIQVFDLNSVSCLFLQTTCSDTVLPIHPVLWPGSVLSAVHLGHGASAWTAHHYGNHEPQTIGIGQSPVPLSKTGSFGKMIEKILVTYYDILYCIINYNPSSVTTDYRKWLTLSMKLSDTNQI